jgi:aspartate aminotransferase
MPTDVLAHLPTDGAAAMRAACTPTITEMKGSLILQIAGDVRRLVESGRQVVDLTVGDFRPKHFPLPAGLENRVVDAIRAGETNYPPADGLPALRTAITRLYERELGIKYSPDSVCVCSGARPPIYATWALFVRPGDRTVSCLPGWNNGYYAQLFGADHQWIRTTAETNFFPTVEQVREGIRGARLFSLNSPLNPTGTVIDPEVLRGIAQAIVEENKNREEPCMWMFDQVYWKLTAPGVVHQNPVALVPEVAPYVVQVDAISKWVAATGLRVGWAVLPPYLQDRMKALIGHIGAWAPRAEQVATAQFLEDGPAMAAWSDSLNGAVGRRLDALHAGISALQARGYPVRAISPQGAIYLSLQVDLVGRGFSSNEQIRKWLLEEAGVAVVPFQAFDLPEENGWFRMSVGAISEAEVPVALRGLEGALERRLGTSVGSR